MSDKKFKAVIIGFRHMHINDVGAHFAKHPRMDLAACADTAPAVPELRVGPLYTSLEYRVCQKNFWYSKGI